MRPRPVSNGMNILSTIYREVIYRPLLNGLVAIYLFLPYHDLGFAIVALTVAVRLILHPAISQAIRSQHALARIQPRLREIQERLKGDKEAQAKETMALYRAEGVNPLSGCLPLLIQLPVLIGLYRLFWKGLSLTDRSLLYSFLPPLEIFNPIAFGLFDLTQASIPLAIAAGLSQFLQGHFIPQPRPIAPASGSGDFSTVMQWQTRYVFPIIIAAISWSLPSALAFYWTIFNLFAILQQRFIEWRMSYERGQRTHHPDPAKDGRAG